MSLLGLEYLRRVLPMDNEKIDEILYGPAWVDETGQPTLRGVCCRLLHYAPKRVTVEQLNRIWEHPELGRLKSAFERDAEGALAEAGLHHYWGDEWRQFALRGRRERWLAFQWESLSRVVSFALSSYGRTYHCLREMVVAIAEEQAVTMHVLTRQAFELGTALLFVRLHLEHAHILVTSLVAQYEQRYYERYFPVCIAQGTAIDQLGAAASLDILDDDRKIIEARVRRQHGQTIASLHADPDLPIIAEYYNEILKRAAPPSSVDRFHKIRERTEWLDEEKFGHFEAVKRWRWLGNAGFSACCNETWFWLSGVTHGVHGPPVWDEIGNSQKEIKKVLIEDVLYPALLYFSASCFVITATCFRELFGITEGEGFREAFVELRGFDPRTGHKRGVR